jgi:hypothetical protein
MLGIVKNISGFNGDRVRHGANTHFRHVFSAEAEGRIMCQGSLLFSSRATTTKAKGYLHST